MPVCLLYVYMSMYVLTFIYVEVHMDVCLWRSEKIALGMVSQAPFPPILKGLLLSWVELAKEASLASLLCSLVVKSQVHATVPGFSTWFLGIKLRSVTKPLPWLLSICLFFLKISNQFVYLKFNNIKNLQLTFLCHAHKDSSVFNTMFVSLQQMNQY